VDANITVAGLIFAETNGFHNTVINPGVTLTVSNSGVAIPLLSGTQTDAGAAAQNYNTISGAGAFVINSTNAGSAMVVQQCSANSGSPQHLSTLDLSGLNQFNATVGRLLVGVKGFTNTIGQVPLPNITRPSSLLILAKTNIIRTTQLGSIQGPIDAANGRQRLREHRGAGDVMRRLRHTAIGHCAVGQTAPFSQIRCSGPASHQLSSIRCLAPLHYTCAAPAPIE
jgi:hypothetical protein